MRLLGWLRSSPDDDPDDFVGYEMDPEAEDVPPGREPYPLPEGELQDVLI